MSLHKIVDEQFRNAIEAGEFDNLEGAGRPLDLNAYFNTPEDLRIGYSVLKSSLAFFSTWIFKVLFSSGFKDSE